MGKVLAIDYGTVRCGVAETDPMKIIASGLTVLPPAKLLTFLEEFCKREKVDVIVIGESRNERGDHNRVEAEIKSFIDKLRKRLPEVEIAREDESYTSVMAQQSMFLGGVKKKQRQKKERLDLISATIILQQYLERQSKH
ncbi:MAG: Holliday junction resolvase RuvX [Cryomorphaceae bacterium]|nr:Holliday junction resolvase RuvX [Cryomorphaceae bacterium]